MMKKRSFLAATVMVALGVLLFAVAATAAPVQIKYAMVGNETNPTYISIMQVKDFIEKKSNGEIQFQVYPNGQLGGDRQILEGMQLGTIEMGIVGISVMSNFNPKFGIFDLPFLFKDEQTAYKALDGELGAKISELAIPLGFRILGYGTDGYRHVSNNRGPIKKPADLSGLKIRTMENPVHISTFKALGANPTPMSFGELYMALQQKTVDAQENPVVLTYNNKFYEVQKYYSLTGHVYAVVPILISDICYQRLSEKHREIVEEGAAMYTELVRAEISRQNDELLKKVEEAGMQVNSLSDEEKAEFVKAVAPVYKEFESVLGKDLVDTALQYTK